MSKIPDLYDNPNGLHARYYVNKVSGEPTHPEAEYFVLRLDDYGKDKNHVNACRKAVLKYADEIEPHIPELAKDLRERYSKLL